MDGNFYKYEHDFIKNGEIFKDKNNNKFRFNKNKLGEYRGGQAQVDKDGNLLSIRYVDDNNNALNYIYKNGEVYAKFQEKLIGEEYVKNGTYEQYKDGIVVKTGKYLEGELHDRWITLDDNNKIEVKRFDKGKDVSGIEEKKFKDRLVKTFPEIVDGVTEKDIGRATKMLIANMIELFEKSDGAKIPQIKLNFKETPELAEGDVEHCYTSFYKDGSPKLFAEKVTKENGELKFEGSYVEHFDNGKVKINARYDENGKLDGLFKEYDESGVLIKACNYKGGVNEEEKINKNKATEKEKTPKKTEEKKNIKIPKKSKKKIKDKFLDKGRELEK
ncbi:MAG: hypothetical protein KGV57_04670 [Fusobacterium sp.]|nr:hypothetical protein [Fusobacterium sp.]